MQSPLRCSQIESAPNPKTRSWKEEQRVGNRGQQSAGLERTWKAAAISMGMSAPGLRVPPHQPHSHSPRCPGTPASQSRSHLSNEGVSDFPVIPFSTSEAVTHCSLLDIIAWAWEQITYDQLGTCGLNPKASMSLSQSLRYLQPKTSVTT